jgi:hypothetical protein
VARGFRPESKTESKEDARSSDVDLPGDKRSSKKVEFAHRSEHHNEKAEIKLFGFEK